MPRRKKPLEDDGRYFVLCGVRYWRIYPEQHEALLQMVLAGQRPDSTTMINLYDLHPVTASIVPGSVRARLLWEHYGTSNLDAVTPEQIARYHAATDKD